MFLIDHTVALVHAARRPLHAWQSLVCESALTMAGCYDSQLTPEVPMSTEPPPRPPPRPLRAAAIILSVVLAAIVICIGGATFFGGTKVRTLFAVSAEALGGAEAPPPDAGADGGAR